MTIYIEFSSVHVCAIQVFIYPTAEVDPPPSFSFGLKGSDPKAPNHPGHGMYSAEELSTARIQIGIYEDTRVLNRFSIDINLGSFEIKELVGAEAAGPRGRSNLYPPSSRRARRRGAPATSQTRTTVVAEQRYERRVIFRLSAIFLMKTG
ncbi:hypothetical protein EVAR_32082_1 [Eumeta japonica]|uniref:Uncharacterized protein n=1 Tax=Eumeta variegata TaxID=151549 RepID=A0A4C1V6D7_EUMVA|nr:hypothetical protein EVAR_32082_1 [Eumeta japonica]